MDDHMQRAREFYAAAYSDLGVDIPPSVWTVTFETSATLRAIAAALRSQGAQAVPEGMLLVQTQDLRAVLQRGAVSERYQLAVKRLAAMLAAAPKPEVRR